EARENVFVDCALDERDRPRAPLGDDRRAVLAGALEPVHTALPLTDPERCDRHWLDLWIELAPGANGRMALELRPPPANSGRHDRRLRARGGSDGIGDGAAALEHEEP